MGAEPQGGEGKFKKAQLGSGPENTEQRPRAALASTRYRCGAGKALRNRARGREGGSAVVCQGRTAFAYARLVGRRGALLLVAVRAADAPKVAVRSAGTANTLSAAWARGRPHDDM